MRALYSIVLTLLTPALLWRARRKYGPGQTAWRQRLGLDCPAVERPIWIHAASVGESRAIAGLVNRLIDQGATVLVTTTTPTGRDQVKQLMPRATHAFLPYDRLGALKNWIARINPKVLALVETELWPNLIAASYEAQVPTVLINARLSEKSARGYARLGSMARVMLSRLTHIYAQTAEDVARFESLGAERVTQVPSIKFDLEPLDPAQIRSLGEGDWWVAASTHEGEERACIDAFMELSHRHPKLRLLLVPRHPQRFDAVAQLHPDIARLSDGESVSRLVLGDAMGQLRGWYTQAKVVFVGGTLIDHGGQNPIEPAFEGCSLIAGPSRYNFESVFEALPVCETAVTAAQLSEAVERALQADGAANAIAIETFKGATDVYAEALMQYVEGSTQ